MDHQVSLFIHVIMHILFIDSSLTVVNVIMAGARTSPVNVALNKPTWQSSVYCDIRGCHGANKSNDGNMGTSLHGEPGCTHTQEELNPWIAIDLGGAIYVDSVDVTSRDDRSQCPQCGAYFSSDALFSS